MRCKRVQADQVKARPPAFRRGLARLVRDRSGVTAVELALISPVFLFMLFVVLEMGIQFMTQLVLDHAVSVGARQVQIGNATTSSAFLNAVCGATSSALIPSCSSNLQVYVTSGSSFSGMTMGNVTSSGTLSPTTFSPGTAGSDVLIEVAYSRPYLFGFISKVAGSRTAALLSVVAVQTEPY